MCINLRSGGKINESSEKKILEDLKRLIHVFISLVKENIECSENV